MNNYAFGLPMTLIGHEYQGRSSGKYKLFLVKFSYAHCLWKDKIFVDMKSGNCQFKQFYNKSVIHVIVKLFAYLFFLVFC